MRAGLLQEFLIFKEPNHTTFPTGEVSKVYKPILKCRAQRRKMAAVMDKDGINAMEKFIGVIILFQIRYNPVIKENWRVEYQGREYSIKLLEKQPDNTYLVTLERLNS